MTTLGMTEAAMTRAYSVFFARTDGRIGEADGCRGNRNRVKAAAGVRSFVV